MAEVEGSLYTFRKERHGIKVILGFSGQQGGRWSSFSSAGIALAASNRDIVLGVAPCQPGKSQDRGLDSNEPLTASQTKRAPAYQVWLVFNDTSPAELDYSMPEEVDVLFLNCVDCSTLAEVRKRQKELFPKWIAKAKNRPRILGWDSWSNQQGLVPSVESGMFQMLAEAAKDNGFSGLGAGHLRVNWIRWPPFGN